MVTSRIAFEDFFTYVKNNSRFKLPKDDFFKFLRDNFIDLTFEDVKLKTNYSEVVPANVSTFSYFSRNIPLNVPIVSSPMDTVTEKNLAIAMAKSGGLGIIHKNLDPETQKDHINAVKHHLSAKIEKPICVYPDQTMQEIQNWRIEKGYNFHSFPVVKKDSGKLLGIITQNDFDFCSNLSLPVDKVMSSLELVTADALTTVDQAYTLMIRNKKKTLPLIDEKGRIAGLYVFNDIKRVKSGEFEIYNVDDKGRLLVGAAIGVGEDGLRRIELLKGIADVFVLDSAHADTKSMIGTLKDIKKTYPSLEIVIGNITELESAKRLLTAGADGIKVGQGPGSICTTRIISGVGKPQVSAIYECSLIADYHKVPVIADGGIKYSGDITIAIGAGASSVMLGSLLAGTTESPGKEIIIQGRKFKAYRGMGSLAAMTEHKGSKERYSQIETAKEKLVPEGIEGMVPYIRDLKDALIQFVGGLKSGMGYVGASNIPELRMKANFNRQTAAGAKEAHPSITITNESPNYSK